MTAFVDHNNRRNLILEASFKLFAREGFEGVTFRKIADSCGISRTLIYRYFKDKEQIFLYAVKQGTDKMSAVVRKVMDRNDLSVLDRLRRILHLTVKLLSENRVFLSVILDYLAIQKQAGTNVRRKVRRFTFGMKFLIERLIREAVAENLLSESQPAKAAGHLFSLLEACVLNLTVIEVMGWRDYLPLIDSYINEKRI